MSLYDGIALTGTGLFQHCFRSVQLLRRIVGFFVFFCLNNRCENVTIGLSRDHNVIVIKESGFSHQLICELNTEKNDGQKYCLAVI